MTGDHNIMTGGHYTMGVTLQRYTGQKHEGDFVYLYKFGWSGFCPEWFLQIHTNPCKFMKRILSRAVSSDVSTYFVRIDRSSCKHDLNHHWFSFQDLFGEILYHNLISLIVAGTKLLRQSMNDSESIDNITFSMQYLKLISFSMVSIVILEIEFTEILGKIGRHFAYK